MKLAVFDFDSTLMDGETIEFLAREVGIEEQVKKITDSVGSRTAALCLRLCNAVYRQLCCLAEKRRYAGRHFSAVSLFRAAGLSQRYFMVSL